VVVTVSSELTPELVREGLAREIVHRIQNLRKEAGFEIADRIHAYVKGDGAVSAVLKAHGEYIAQETLAVQLWDARPPARAQQEAASIDGYDVTLGVERA
jgi:isoleucyl-tRNA synthetase